MRTQTRNILIFIFGILILSFRSNQFEYRKIVNSAFSAGEDIEFRVHYGFVTAGYGSARVLPYVEKMRGRDVYHIIGKGTSTSGFDWFFKVRDEFHTYIDINALVPLKYSKDQQEGSFISKDEATFDHENNMITNSKRTFSMPSFTQDVLSLMYYARCLDFRKAEKGLSYQISFYLDDEITTISFKVMGREVISTDLGKFNAIKIHPQVIADRVFKSKDAVTLWVSDDANLLPLRIQADLLIGSIKADITEYKNLKNNTDALIK